MWLSGIIIIIIIIIKLNIGMLFFLKFVWNYMHREQSTADILFLFIISVD